MATPDAQTNQISHEHPVAGTPAAIGAGDSRLTSYMLRWWFLPMLGMAMLLALWAMLLGAEHELYAVAVGGVALFGAVFIVLVFATGRYIWLLGKGLTGLLRLLRSKNIP